jgi:hypothetical protein
LLGGLHLQRTPQHGKSLCGRIDFEKFSVNLLALRTPVREPAAPICEAVEAVRRRKARPIP